MYKVVAPLYSPVFSDFLKSVDTDTLLNPNVSPILPVTGEKINSFNAVFITEPITTAPSWLVSAVLLS